MSSAPAPPSAAPLVTMAITASASCPSAAAAAALPAISVSRAPGSTAQEPTDLAPFSFLYTGRHDGGELPPLKEGSHYALLLDALAEGRVQLEAQLAVLAQADSASAGSAAGSAAKKPRVEEQEAAQ